MLLTGGPGPKTVYISARRRRRRARMGKDMITCATALRAFCCRENSRGQLFFLGWRSFIVINAPGGGPKRQRGWVDRRVFIPFSRAGSRRNPVYAILSA
jgi:hypothetical protein